MPDPANNNPTPGQPRRRWRRWVLLLILLPLFGWLTHYTHLRLTHKPEPRDDYWLEKIKAIDPAPPGNLPYKTVLAFLAKAPWLDEFESLKPGMPRDLSYALHGPWDTSRKDIEALCQMFESDEFIEYRSNLLSIVKRGWVLDDIDHFFDIAYPVLQHTRIFLAHSRWAIHNQDWETAKQDWLLVMAIAREVRRPHFQLNVMYGKNLNRMVAEEIIHASQESDLFSSMKGLAREIQSRINDPDQPCLEMANAEWCFNMALLDRYYVRRQNNGWIDIPSVARSTELVEEWPPVKTLERLWNLLSFVFHDYIQATEAASRFRDSYKNVRNLDDLNQTTIKDMRPVDGSVDWCLLYTHLGRNNQTHETIERFFSLQMELDASITILAIKEFKHNMGRFPDSLVELVPEYCEIPIDRADGKPMRYKRTQTGYLLYSIWLDGEDDGGECIRKDDNIIDPELDWLFMQEQRSDYFLDELVENPS